MNNLLKKIKKETNDYKLNNQFIEGYNFDDILEYGYNDITKEDIILFNEYKFEFRNEIYKQDMPDYIKSILCYGSNIFITNNEWIVRKDKYELCFMSFTNWCLQKKREAQLNLIGL